MESLWAILALLGVVSLAFLWARAREGRVRTLGPNPVLLLAKDLGSTRGARATFVQFSTDTCSKCPPTAALLRRVTESAAGVRHVEIDAVTRMDLVRRFGIHRTPTILVLDGDGLVVARMIGATTEAAAREALDLAPPPAAEYSI